MLNKLNQVKGQLKKWYWLVRIQALLMQIGFSVRDAYRISQNWANQTDISTVSPLEAVNRKIGHQGRY